MLLPLLSPIREMNVFLMGPSSRNIRAITLESGAEQVQVRLRSNISLRLLLNPKSVL